MFINHNMKIITYLKNNKFFKLSYFLQWLNPIHVTADHENFIVWFELILCHLYAW